MHLIRPLTAALALHFLVACADSEDPAPVPVELPDTKQALDLTDVAANPEQTQYEWMDFRPNVKKLFLAGDATSEHIAVLWYTVEDGAVGLHYHAKTESVYVIDGTQTDMKGEYETATVYFNPPGSGHQISDSSGFFLLAYAAPPDFMSTDLIGEYEPIRIETDDPDLTSTYTFDEEQSGVTAFSPPLDESGGMTAKFIETTSSSPYTFDGNYVLVVKGKCLIDGVNFGEDELVVGKNVDVLPYTVAAPSGSTCLALGVSF